MNMLLSNGDMKTELHVTPPTEHTTITLKRITQGSILIYENDECIGWLAIPVMKVIRALRSIYPQAKYELI